MSTAYRFFGNEKTTSETILMPHAERTRERMAQHSVALLVQDTQGHVQNRLLCDTMGPSGSWTCFHLLGKGDTMKNLWHGTRREFLRAGGAGIALAGLGPMACETLAQLPGERPSRADGVRVLNPQMRVPISFVIDDSTCLANFAHFGMPQFAQTWGEQKDYLKSWQKTPREIPDSFVRKFGQWCHERGVKGKYSVIPYPACVGWIDRFLPGWSARELADSLKLIRELMLPDWDIHPEMVSHTRVINTKTGRPYEDASPRFMENWGWSTGKSADELADYLSYALRILKNVGLPCEGVTSPGNFGMGARPEYAQAVLQSCRDVFQTEIPHYYMDTDAKKSAPRVQCASGLGGADPRCVVSIICCTSDWFGGWNGLENGSIDMLISKDLQSGRMVEVIDRGEPAVMRCHWPAIYYNGEETGFNIFKEAVARLHARYDNLIWMKLSELARYWAAKELTRIDRQSDGIELSAPFAAPRFTLSLPARGDAVPQLFANNKRQSLKEVSKPLLLQSGAWLRDKNDVVVCFDLPKGNSRLQLA